MVKEKKFYFFVDYIILALFSFYINFYYSNIGVLAQDTFAYYDTGFRILNGSVPFKDYWTVSGPFIDYLQATIFFFLGVSWKSYIIIGSILNSLITIIFYYTLTIFNQNKLSSLFYAFCFSILANPSMGTPFPDHFSTFFSLVGIFFFLLAIQNDKKFFWLLIPICFFFAFFCKQSPSSYILLVLFISLSIYLFNHRNFEIIKYLVFSSVFCLVLLTVFFIVNEINLKQFLHQYILFPQTIAEKRISEYQFTFNNIFQYKFIFLYLFPLILITFINLRKKIFLDEKIFLFNFIGILLSIVLIFHQIITKNFIFIFFLVPFLGSLIHGSLSDSLKFKKYIIALLVTVTFFVTAKYHLRFNEDRKMLNLENVDIKNNVDSEFIHSSLKGLKWITYKYPRDPIKEIELIKDSLKIINQDNSKKMLLTDYLFFSSVLGKDLHNPSRWPSLQDASNPDIKNIYYPFYKEFIINLVKLKKIETLYTTVDNQGDIFLKIFDEKCLKTKEINDFLTKHDIKNCIK
tara:strand:- start:1 stop:1551 length:1551 start_codon:yes stop_codon:yes gene_type:complete